MMPETLQQAGLKSVQDVMQTQGKVFRSVVGRKTIQVNLANKSYYIKQHFGVGWGEIFKNLLTFKLPILGAMTEVRAIQKLDEIGIATTPLMAYGQQGCSPASVQSFVVTEDLGDIVSLEEVCADWKISPPDIRLKQKIIIAIAQLAAKFHSAGLSHRDFYLCHFVLIKTEFESGHLNLHLIDLHRMLQGQQANSSVVMKDIAGLYFSMQQIGLGAEDWAIFKQYYLPQSDGFWAQVEARAAALLAKFNSEKFQKRLSVEKSALD
jgi:UDP-glucose:(heptosyl)LPS alpha-1,3-glucosyltransferase/heptose I phosphotransferase